jgi:hypothetical protein
MEPVAPQAIPKGGEEVSARLGCRHHPSDQARRSPEQDVHLGVPKLQEELSEVAVAGSSGMSVAGEDVTGVLGLGVLTLGRAAAQTQGPARADASLVGEDRFECAVELPASFLGQGWEAVLRAVGGEGQVQAQELALAGA